MFLFYFLTAKSLETDKMEALSAGGDDYLVKPFSYVELIARIQALIRRCRVYDNADASDTTASSTIERRRLNLIHKNATMSVTMADSLLSRIKNNRFSCC